MNEPGESTCPRCEHRAPVGALWCASCNAAVCSGARGRRAFIAAAANTAALAAVGGAAVLLGGCNRSRSAEPTDEDGEQAAAKRELAEPPSPEPSSAQAYEPERDRVYSRAHYEDLVVAATPYAAMAKHADASLTAVKLRAIELDFFDDDVYWRKGDVVLLGEQDGMLIGFCHRYIVDMRYPSNAVNYDGVGSAEWGRHSLVVDTERYDLQQLERHERPRPGGDRIGWQAIGDHDAAILYIPKSASSLARAPSLAIPNPVEALRDAIRQSSTMFGLDYVLVSPKAFEALRQGVATRQRLPLATFLVGLALGSLFFAPLLGQWAAGVTVSSGRLAEAGRAVLRKALPVALRLTGKTLVSSKGIRGDDGQARGLLGVEWPSEPEALAMLDKFFATVLMDGEGHFVAYEGPDARGGQLFVPERRMSVNAELLARGLTRLDLRQFETLHEHPQLAEAALDAVDARRNLAGQWADDEAYRQVLSTLVRG